MSDKEALIALAERCEQAAGPDRELDGEVWIRLHKPKYRYPGEVLNRRPDSWHEAAERFNHDGYGGSISRPRYTASIDAAMTLVPGGWSRGQWSEIGKKDSARLWYGEHDIIAAAATPALAITAAALRARAVQS